MYIITIIIAILILIAFFEYLYALNPQRVLLHYAPGQHHILNSYLIIYVFSAFSDSLTFPLCLYIFARRR